MIGMQTAHWITKIKTFYFIFRVWRVPLSTDNCPIKIEINHYFLIRVLQNIGANQWYQWHNDINALKIGKMVWLSLDWCKTNCKNHPRGGGAFGFISSYQEMLWRPFTIYWQVPIGRHDLAKTTLEKDINDALVWKSKVSDFHWASHRLSSVKLFKLSLYVDKFSLSSKHLFFAFLDSAAKQCCGILYFLQEINASKNHFELTNFSAKTCW